MNSKTENAMHAATIETFAELAFIDTIPQESCSLPPVINTVLSIDFLAPCQGNLLLLLPLALKKKIAENIYAADPSGLEAGECEDCLRELLNVLGGNFLNRYFGTKVDHSLSLPTLIPEMKTTPQKPEQMEFGFNAEGEFFKVLLTFTPEENNASLREFPEK